MKKPIELKLTREGFDNLKAEVAALFERRPGVLSRMVLARDQGDLSENAGYHAAKEELGRIDRRTRELKILIRFADVVDGNSSSVVGFGSVVTVINDGEKTDFKIVNKIEADPIRGKLSDVSPIGSALLGKKVWDVVDVDIPDGKITFTILKIH